MNKLISHFRVFTLIIFIAISISSCSKKEEQPSSVDLKKKELEQKEKELDQMEKEINSKDSIKTQSNYNWEGEYNCITKEGKNHEWHFELKIIKEQNGYSATFYIWGHQTNLPMKCTVSIEGNRAKIYFDKFYAESGANDKKKGDLLIELEQNNGEILTFWHKAMILGNEKSGVVAFKKIPNSSFTFLNKELLFGSMPDSFLETYTEFKMNNELKNSGETGASYTLKPKDCEINFNVYFDKSGLKRFEMKSNCSSGQDEKIIKGILKQFKFIPSKNSDDEEMGDVVETYKKGKLTATAFIGGFYILTIQRTK